MGNKQKPRVLRVYANTQLLRRGMWEISTVTREVENLIAAGLAAWVGESEEKIGAAEAEGSAENEGELEDGSND